MPNVRQIPFDFPMHPAMGREDFLVSDCNREALAFVERWPDWKAPALYIYGPEGSGKTHIAHIWKARAGDDAQIIDGLDDLLGARPSEETLFHLYNRLRLKDGALLITGTKPLSLCNFVIPDLASRLKSSPQVAIGLPDEDLLRMLLVKLFADRQMRLDIDVIEYALARMERSFAAARTLVAALDARSLDLGRPVSSAMVRTLLDTDQDSFEFINNQER